MFERFLNIFNNVRKFVLSHSAIMTLYLIVTLAATIIIRKIAAISSETNVNFPPKNSSFVYTFEKTVPISSSEETDEIKFDQEVDNSTEIITSQDRISYHAKRGASYPHRFNGHYHHHVPHHPHHHHHHHHSRPPFYKPPRKKYRRGRKKPSMGRGPYLKSPYKRQKPILLSEVLRNGGYSPYSKIKPSLPIIKDYIEDDDLETSPFSTIDNIDSFPPFTRNNRPQSIEITEDTPDVLPVQPIEEEIIIPGISNGKPYTSVIKRPPGSIWSSSKPSDLYLDSDTQDNTRNVRYAANKPQQSYLDQDIINLLQKIKNDGMNSDSKPSSSEFTSQIQKNITDTNVAISKLLFPFLSENAIKQIQLYFKSLPSDKQHKDDKFSLENEILGNTTQSTLLTQNPPPKQYSVTESVKEDDGDNATYFIMVKSPAYKGINATTLLSQKLNQFRWLRPEEQGQNQKDVNSTTPPSKESLALQKYIMMLAGITKESGNADNYLPRFNSFQKQSKKA